MTAKTWKSLALLSLIATTNGVNAHERLRRGAAVPQDNISELPQEWGSATEEITVLENVNVENVDWFVDKEGRRLSADRPLTELVAQTFVLQFMEAALVFSGLANMLNGDGPYTMMITWDYEWERQPYVNKYKTAPWRRHLREMLEFCIYEGDVPPEGNTAYSMELYMMNGEAATVAYDGSRSQIEGFRNIGTTEVENGFVYLLQDIIEPSFLSFSLYDLISSDHSVFSSLLVSAGLHTTLQDTRENVGLTVFAPTNTAFDRFNPGFVNYLNSNSNDRRAFLQYHMAEPVFPTMNMYPNSNIPLTTKQGGQLTMRLNNRGVLTITAAIGSAKAVTTDKLAYNGIIHVVDSVLRHKNFNGISAPSPTNIRNHIRSSVPSTSVFNDSNSYQSRALEWVVGSCPNCGRDGARIIQRFVLACIYYATNNVANPLTRAANGGGIGTWRINSGWVGSSDECTWYGVECNDSGYVDYINLRENKLSGTFPSETKLLAGSLKVLDLTKNSMYNDGSAGNDWLGDLSKLQYLSVSQTGFSYDGIPPAIGRLRELTDLDVSYCLYFGALNTNVFANLDKVTYLDISGNSYNSNAPATIGTMSSLMYFYAIDADLTGNLNFITASKSIQELWIDDNPQFGGSIPVALGNMITLRSLSLSDNNMNGNLPTQLGKLVSMEQMFLYGNDFSGGVPSHFGNLYKLERLELYENSMAGSMPNQVCNLPELDNLEADCGSGGNVRCNSVCCTCCSNCRRSGDKA